MRTILFFFCLILLVFSGWFISIGSLSFDGILTTENAPVSQWDSLLIGTWKYDFQSQGGEHYIIGEGEITFKADKSYFFYKTDNYYNDKRHTKHNASIVAGGSVLGTWKTENGCIGFTVEKCNLKVTTDDYGELANPCETTLLNIGDFLSENGVGKLHALNEETIIFKFKDYSDNSVDQITLTKKTNN